MTDSAETTSATSADSGAAAVSDQPVTASATAAWSQGPSAQESAVGMAGDHPELIVGAAFAGGLLLAAILKRLAG
jgi:hypothetical protein